MKMKNEYNNPFYLNDVEYQRMLELKTYKVKMVSKAGIGISKKCKVKGKWVDITDYDTW